MYVEDFVLQDIGSAVYTEYDMNGDTASYYADHIDTLLGCKIATLHSHNKMAAWFSGTDVSTLYEAGSQMNNVLSIIVNNAGSYVAKFTQKVSIHCDTHHVATTQESSSMSYMGDKEISSNRSYTTNNDTKDDFIKILCYDCEINRPVIVETSEEYRRIEEECKEAINNVRTKLLQKAKTNKTFIVNPTTYVSHKYDSEYSEESSPTSVLIHSLFGLTFDMRNFNPENITDLKYAYTPFFITKLNPSYQFMVDFLYAWFELFKPTLHQLTEIIDIISKDSNLENTTIKSTLLDALSDLIFDLGGEEFVESSMYLNSCNTNLFDE